MFPLKDHQSSGKFPVMTLLIIAVNTLFLLLQFTAENPDKFTNNLAIIPVFVDYKNAASLYPFLTAMFLHAGFLHFFANMWFLQIFGDNVEAALGKISYLFLYLSGGIVASLIELFFIENSSIPIIGASGAIAAVLGFYLIMFPKHTITTLLPIFPFLATVNLPSFIVLGLWFLSQLFSGGISLVGTAGIDTGGVAWWAHIGGFTYGMIIALLYRVFQPK